LNANYGREAADVASAITNARATERERLQAVNTENFNRGKQVYDAYGNIMQSGRADLQNAAGGTRAIAGLYSGQAGAFEKSANDAASRATGALTGGYNAQIGQAGRDDAANARWGEVAGKVGAGAVDWWKNRKIDPTGGQAGTGATGAVENWGMDWAGQADGGAIRGYAEGGEVDETGGEIKGPGTGTSDSVSAIKKPGTFILSADTVRALGHKKLEDLMEKAGVRKSYGGGDGEDSDRSGTGVRLSNGEWAMPPEVTKYHGEEFFNKLQQKFHRPVFSGDDSHMANGGAIRKRKLPMDVENAIYGAMPQRAIGRRY
jgi:hypothetical protein